MIAPFYVPTAVLPPETREIRPPFGEQDQVASECEDCMKVETGGAECLPSVWSKIAGPDAQKRRNTLRMIFA